MARVIEAIAGEWVEYVPEAFGNRDDEDPVTVTIKPMSVAEFREWATSSSAAVRGKGGDRRAAKLADKVLRERVKSVANYRIGEAPIATGADLAERGEVDIVNEVFKAITDISVLSEGLKKK